MLAVATPLCFTTCEDEDDSDPTDLLLGTWYLEDMDSYVEVNSKIDQPAVSMLSAGEGAINLTGFHTVSLQYLWPNAEYGGVVVMNGTAFMDQGMGESIGYMLMIIEQDDYRSASLMVDYGSDSSGYWSTTEIDFTYDSTNSSLTINNSVLHPFLWGTSLDSSDVIYISGTLSNQVIQLGANVTTHIPAELLMTSDMNSIAVFAGETLTLYDEMGEYKDTTIFQWEIYENQLMLTDKNDSPDVEDWDLMYVDYSVSENQLVLSFKEDCESDGLCLDEIEEMFILDQGSLNSGVMITTATFTHQAPAMKLVPGFDKFYRNQSLLVNKMMSLNL